MASTTESVTVLRRSSVSPPAAATEMSLPLTYLDMIWLHFFPIERLMFYEISQLSRGHFVDYIIPRLERSLSATLENYLPLAGNLIIPSTSDSGSDSTPSPRMPEIRYVQGNSVTITFAECNETDRFGYFTADEARNCHEFHSLIPELFKPIVFDAASDSDPDPERSIPVLGIQVTLFPGFGISIGISNHHSVGDASTVFRFMKTWASFSLNSQIQFAESVVISDHEHTLPFYDRSIIDDPKGLAPIFFDRWNRIIQFVRSSDSTISIDAFLDKVNINVRKTFVFSRKDVERLKSSAVKNRGKVLHLSSFTAACAYVWTCLVKSGAPTGEDVGEEEPEHFSFYAECRGRMDPTLPKNYFGNCLTHCLTTTEHGKLVGPDGFRIAAELIGKTIQERLKSSGTLFSDAAKWMQSPNGGGKWQRDVGVAGSPKYNYYDLDFGWGKPAKFEFISIDLTGAISLSGCREANQKWMLSVLFLEKGLNLDAR